MTVTHSHQRPLRITAMKADIEDQIKRKDDASDQRWFMLKMFGEDAGDAGCLKKRKGNRERWCW